MRTAKRIGGLTIAALIATASLAPTSADARGGRRPALLQLCCRRSLRRGDWQCLLGTLSLLLRLLPSSGLLSFSSLLRALSLLWVRWLRSSYGVDRAAVAARARLVVVWALEWHDRQRAWSALLSVLHVLRDCLGCDEVVYLGAQLPPLLRGFYCEGWHPRAHKPNGPRRVPARIGDGLKHDLAVDASS